MSSLTVDEDTVITGEKVKIREKKLADARNDYAWSRDLELSRLDAAKPLDMSFADYISEYTSELRYPSLTRHRFAIETMTGEHIGNCSYYNIDLNRSETEVGIIMGNRDYWGKGYGTDAVKALVKYIFEQTTFNRLYLKTLEWNIQAQQCFKKGGFTPYNRILRDGYKFLMMELTREQWVRLTTAQESNERDTLPAR